MSLNRYAFVNNNPMTYFDPNGHDWAPIFDSLATSPFVEEYVINPALDFSEKSMSYDYSFSTPSVPSMLAPYIPTLNLNISKDVNLNYSDGIFTSEQIGVLGAVTPSNNFGAGYNLDQAAQYNIGQGFKMIGEGLAVNIQYNGQILLDKASFVGNNLALEAFGAVSVQDYLNQSRNELNQAVINSIYKAKDERTMKLIEAEERAAELAVELSIEKELLDMYEQFEDGGIFYKNLSDDGRLEKYIIFEKAIAYDIDLDTSEFEMYKQSRSFDLSSYENKFYGILDYLFMGGDEISQEKEDRGNLVEFYLNTSDYVTSFTDEDYLALAEGFREIQKSNQDDMMVVVMGISGGIKGVGGSVSKGMGALNSVDDIMKGGY